MGVGVGLRMGVGFGVGLRMGVGFGLAILTPLLQTNFFPNFTHVYLLPDEIAV